MQVVRGHPEEPGCGLSHPAQNTHIADELPRPLKALGQLGTAVLSKANLFSLWPQFPHSYSLLLRAAENLREIRL